MWARRFDFLVACAEPATAKKEDNPEQALKEFRAIVEKEEEKGEEDKKEEEKEPTPVVAVGEVDEETKGEKSEILEKEGEDGTVEDGEEKENPVPDPTIRFLVCTQTNRDGSIKDPQNVTGVIAKLVYCMVS